MIETKIINLSSEIKHISDPRERAAVLLQLITDGQAVKCDDNKSEKIIDGIEKLDITLKRYFEDKEYRFLVCHLKHFIETDKLDEESTAFQSNHIQERFERIKNLLNELLADNL